VLTFLEVAVVVGQACDNAGISYCVTGSVAGAVHGVARMTQDIDIVIELSAWRVDRLVELLGREFEVDAQSLKEAAAAGRSWNIFHLPSMTKIDLFMLEDDRFAESGFTRRQRVALPGGGSLQVLSVEDLILRKLKWFRQGGEVSSQQWRDVLGLLNTHPGLELAYVETWAAKEQLAQLLERALKERESGTP
jgi:hypothetical protein